jgi:acetoin utilization deacetylase AcuC-like enzyme
MRKVCYLYNEDITKYEFSKEHPMKTKRMKMVHSLVNNYGLSSHLKMYHSKQATSEEIASFHHPQYVKYLESWVSPRAELIVEQYSVTE